MLEPPLGLVPVTLRTVAIATGVIDIDLVRAVIALRDMASEVRRTTPLEIPHGPGVTGQQAVPDLRAIGRTVEHGMQPTAPCDE